MVPWMSCCFAVTHNELFVVTMAWLSHFLIPDSCIFINILHFLVFSFFPDSERVVQSCGYFFSPPLHPLCQDLLSRISRTIPCLSTYLRNSSIQVHISKWNLLVKYLFGHGFASGRRLSTSAKSVSYLLNSFHLLAFLLHGFIQPEKSVFDLSVRKRADSRVRMLDIRRAWFRKWIGRIHLWMDQGRPLGKKCNDRRKAHVVIWCAHQHLDLGRN